MAPFPAVSNAPDRRVFATTDGIPQTPEEYSRLLVQLADAGKAGRDTYSQQGVIEQLEKHFASVLGKERAIWMPTGTLANHMAMRLLAGDKRRVLVQQECHLYNDTGDCAQTLSQLHMVPLAPGKATFTLAEVEQEYRRSIDGRVPTPIGAIQIENPVRRCNGGVFDYSEMKRISAWARDKKIGLHLDGARLFLASAYTDVGVKDYSALFDTVYVSLYKYFNAASGAVLAGPKAMLDNLHHARRMFGGGLYQAWPFAAVALHFADGYEQRLRQAVETSETVIKTLSSDGNFEISRIEHGSNIFQLRVRGVNTLIFQQRLEEAGIVSRAPESGDWFQLHVNETWNRRTPKEVLEAFRKALG